MPLLLHLLLSSSILCSFGNAQNFGDLNPLPACGQTCFKNEFGFASACSSSSGLTCLCNNINLINSIRTCASQACSIPDATDTINFANSFCQGAGPSDSTTNSATPITSLSSSTPPSISATKSVVTITTVSSEASLTSFSSSSSASSISNEASVTAIDSSIQGSQITFATSTTGGVNIGPSLSSTLPLTSLATGSSRIATTTTRGVNIESSLSSASITTSSASEPSSTALNRPTHLGKDAKIGIGFGVVIGLCVLVIFGSLFTILRARREEAKNNLNNPYGIESQEVYQTPTAIGREAQQPIEVNPGANVLPGGFDGSQELHGDSMIIRPLS